MFWPQHPRCWDQNISQIQILRHFDKIYATLCLQATFSTAGEALTGRGTTVYPNHCGVQFPNTTHRLRLLFDGGVSLDGVQPITPDRVDLFQVLDAEGTLLPPSAVLGLADLGGAPFPSSACEKANWPTDGDNYVDVCLHLMQGAAQARGAATADGLVLLPATVVVPCTNGIPNKPSGAGMPCTRHNRTVSIARLPAGGKGTTTTTNTSTGTSANANTNIIPAEPAAGHLGQTNAAGAACTEVPGHSCSGHDISNHPSTSAAACCNDCGAAPGCNAFDWYAGPKLNGTPTCFLKTGCPQLNVLANTVAGPNGANPPPPPSYAVLPLGDSITFGCGDSMSPACVAEGVGTACTIDDSPCANCAYGYRYRLFEILNASSQRSAASAGSAGVGVSVSAGAGAGAGGAGARAGAGGVGAAGAAATTTTSKPKAWRFVGTQRTGPKDCGTQGACQHEGHPGWRTTDLSNIVNSTLGLLQPDVILLHIGTNDIGRNHYATPAEAAANVSANLQTLISELFAVAPSAHVFLASIIAMPASCHFYPHTGNLTAQEDAYNAEVPKVAAHFGTLSPRCYSLFYSLLSIYMK